MNRKNLTKAEVLMWIELKGRKLAGYKFQRQKPIDYFILDFFCNKYRLAIEIDGACHMEPDIYKRDLRKNSKMKELGIELLRFTNSDVYERRAWVLDQIKNKLDRLVDS